MLNKDLRRLFLVEHQWFNDHSGHKHPVRPIMHNSDDDIGLRMERVRDIAKGNFFARPVPDIIL